jgi:hypothetical protein
MTLENGEVLQNLTNQLQEVTQQLNTLGETRVKLIGAIEVLQQIEETNNPAPAPAPEAPAEEAPVEEETPAEEASE